MPAINSLFAHSAAQLDAKLMGPVIGYTLDQLVELAGLAVATAVSPSISENQKTLVIAGPGNNGADALVAARHLKLFGHQVEVYYPKQGKTPLYGNLVKQLASMDIKFVNDLPEISTQLVIIDGIFGFSFHGELRPPFDSIVSRIIQLQSKGSIVYSIDIPSGWDVNEGPSESYYFMPNGLISLTAPKPCARFIKGKHWLGGRFLPQSIIDEFNLNDIMTLYKSTDQVVDITGYDIK